jgi:hypothetical protein
MTREILLAATSGRISVTQFDVLDSDRPRDAACDKRDVCQGRAVLRLERDARGKAEANLAFAVRWMPSSRRRTLGGCAHHRGGRRRTTQFFGIVGAPVEALVPTTLASMRAVIEYLVEFDGRMDYLPALLKSSILRSPGCCRGRAR